jgi:hypothetical protein
MKVMVDHEHMTDVACSDPELSQELREALTLLRDGSDNDEFRGLVDDVLAGRCGLFEASGAAAFRETVFGMTGDEQQVATYCESHSGAAPCGSGGCVCCG